MMRHDPVLIFAGVLTKTLRMPQAELDALDKDVIAQVDAAVRYAEESPWPDPQTLYEDVYVRSPYINGAAADKDPAWRSAIQQDRVPESFPAWSHAKVES